MDDRASRRWPWRAARFEVALHPAVYPGNDGSPVAPPSGDEIAKVL